MIQSGTSRSQLPVNTDFKKLLWCETYFCFTVLFKTPTILQNKTGVL